ncbi:MAG: hypothetical protein JSS38_02340 [Nitrospira sp.]|nr:hypothetical protein [Nitrospira sp.]
MRPIFVSVIVAMSLMWGGGLLCVSTASQAEVSTHQQLTTTVEKIQSGLMYFTPTERLGHRAVSLHKAERMGLAQAKAGDEVILVIDESNLLIDVHRKDIPPAGHHNIDGKLTYADRLWEVVEITTAEGKQTFAVDDATGSRLAVLKEGQRVQVELNEDNMVVDIHPIR